MNVRLRVRIGIGTMEPYHAPASAASAQEWRLCLMVRNVVASACSVNQGSNFGSQAPGLWTGGSTSGP